jgi:hypothetical protein
LIDIKFFVILNKLDSYNNLNNTIMKKLICIILYVVLIVNISWSQAPEKLNYQAVIRNSSNELVANQDVGIKVSILDAISSTNALFSEEHSETTNAYGVVNLEIGNVSGDLSSVDWDSGDKFLKIEVDENGGTNYTEMGVVQLLSVPYALFANSANNLGDENIYTPVTDTLFVVKDNDGNVVFAVFPDGAAVYVNEASKGKVGGFAVSGRTSVKGIEEEYLRVTPDSTRVYVNEDTLAKGKVGGFAVSGRTSVKGIVNDYLYVTGDSTRIYVNDSTTVKGKVGGFAVSGRTSVKGISTDYLRVTKDSTRIFTQDTISGFGVRDNSGGKSTSYFQLSPLNYFIGHEAGANNTSGIYNSMIGYQAGFTNSFGSNNLFLGYKAGYLNVTGGNNVFIGTESGYVNQFTFQNTYVGYRSGYDLSGSGNTVMGSMAGENAGGGNNTFIGTSAGCIATGGNNTFVGKGAGYSFPNENTGVRNTYIGQAVGSFTNTGSYNVMLGFNAGYLNYEGSRNTFLGYNTGRNIHEGSGNVFIGYEAGNYANGIHNRLIIDNENIDSTNVLFYGEFDQNHLRINGNVGINYQAYNGYGLIVDVPDGQTSIYTLLIYGNALASGGIWNASDVRFKKNITTYENALNTIMQIRGVSFDWKVDEYPQQRFSDNRQLGFIAQEVEKIVPDLVKEGPDGYKGLEYTKFTPIIVEAIKEQQIQIEKLETENKDLQQRLKKLEELLLK